MGPTSSGKIFGIGLNKTGTRSVAAALRVLGFRTFHKGDATSDALVERAAVEELPLLELLGSDYDAYFDVEAIVHRFRELDAEYPDSRFILTTSDVEVWIDSRRRHVEANRQKAARGRYSGTFLNVDINAWRAEREQHHAAVLGYFAHRDDLLVFDVRAGDDWTTLAPFLGCRIPRRVFPWENREGSGTYTPEPSWHRTRRRIDYAIGRLRRRGVWR